VDDFTCQDCPRDSFCKDNSRYYCPPNSTSILFADSLEDCVCNPGYNRTTEFENQVCVVGQAPYYYLEGVQYACPGHGPGKKVTTDMLSYKVEHCVCTPGYFGIAGSTEECEICAVDFYNANYNTTQCLACSANSQNLMIGSKSAYDCKCEPGYQGQDGEACTACPAGKFKSIFGNSSCETCPENTFSHTGSTSCSQCPGNSTSDAESVSINNCLCNAGFSGVDGGPCVLCAIGKFKDTIVNEACSDCLDNSFSQFEGATSCVSCLDSSAHSTGRDRCLCNAGYTQADTVDTRPDCTPCAVNTYQPGSGETSCFECDANANGPEASATPVTCLCNAGFYDIKDHTCEKCAAGTYKEAASTPEEDENLCSACPLYANSLQRSVALSDCLCNAGYTGTIGVAVQTAVTWTFNDYYSLSELTIAAGSDITITSPAGHPFIIMQVESHPNNVDASEVFADPVVDSLAGTATTTVNIPADYTGQLWWYCKYHSGMPHGEVLWNVVNTCEACDPGHFKPANGSAACAECTLNFFSDTSASTACESCVEFLNSDGAKTDASASDSSDDCVCDLGLGYVQILDQYNARTCTGCQPGSYATADGCANCTNGQFSDVAGLTVCKDCPANSSSYDYPHVACQCHVGYYCPASADDIPQKSFQFGNRANWVPAFQNAHFKQSYGADILPEATESEIDVEWAHITSQTSFCDDDIIPFATDSYQWGVSARKSFLFNILDYWPNRPRGLGCNQESPFFTSKQDACYDIIMDLIEEKGPCQLRTCSNSDKKSISSTTGGPPNVMCKNYDDVKMTEALHQADNIDWTEVVITYVTHKNTGLKYLAYLYYLKGKVGHEDSTKIFISIPTYFISNPLQTNSNFLSHAHVGGVDLQGESVESWNSGDYYSDDVLPGILKDASGQSLWELDDEFGIQISSKETNTVPVVQTSGCLCFACPMDTFKNYTGEAASCYACQANSVSDLASVSQDDCECGFGYKQDGPYTCVACLAGHYADTLDSATCTPCGDRFYTTQSDFPWTNIGECNQCLICYNDEYDAANDGLGCGNGTATECQACPEHKSLLEAFTLDNWQAGVESCKCDPGYEPEDSSIPSTCQTCAFNFFKSNVGDVQCTECPSTTVTEFEGADSLDSCVCPAGYYFEQIDGIRCVLCAAGTYKTGLSRQAVCDACTNHSTSEAGSDESSDCLCLPGFGAVGGPGTTMSLHMARWQSEHGTFIGNVIAPEPEILQARSPQNLVDYYDVYQNKPKSVELMSQLQTYITSPCNSGDYSGSLAEIAEQLTQSPCASNYGNELYATDESQYVSCLFMAVDYTVDGVTNKSPAVVYLNLHKDWDNKYYQLMIRIYQAGVDVEYDLNHQRCGARDNNDPAIIGGTPKSGDWQFTETSLRVTLFLQPSLESSCEICPTGEQKNVTANEPCEVCAVNTFAVNSGTRVCEACAVGKSTILLTGQSYCECDAGTERESSDVLSVCQDCAEGKFKAAPSYDEASCQNCGHCGTDQQVETVCDRFQNITCKACQDNSWSNAERTELGPCLCNAGYELVNSECVACPIGKARTTNYNNSIACEVCQDGKFADTEAASECEFCASHCNGTIGGLQSPPVYLNYARMCGSDGDSACLTDGGSTSATFLCDYCDAGMAVDGLITDQSNEQFDARNLNEPDPGCMLLEQRDNYWWVDLGEPRAIERIKIYGPKGFSNLDGRYNIGGVLLDDMNEHGLLIRVGNNAEHATVHDLEQNPVCAANGHTGVIFNNKDTIFQDMVWISTGGYSTSTSGVAEIECIAEGRYVTIQPNGDQTRDLKLGICEIQVEGQDSVALNTYVIEECEATTDTVCVACTPCPPGQYAIQSCGIPFNNDRNDTKCALCPAGSYCPGGTDGDGVDVQPLLCPDLSTSTAGSGSILDCQCAPGYFHNGEVCQLCVLDTYCPGNNVIIECPRMGFTHQIGSSNRLDCHCLPGHFRNPPQDLENFNCSICTPNDWCFNNLLYDCPDIRMISNSGSKSFQNCTCMDGFYNNGSKCEECPLDHFCIDGNVFECDPMEWTNHLKRQGKCLCRPKLFRTEEICTACTEDFYCDGTDDLRKACPSNSISAANSSRLQECLCVPGFEHIHTNNHTLTHTCVGCVTGKFKDSYGMYLCNPCRRCLAINNVYELQSCTTTHDSRCDSCETCHKSHPDEEPRFVEVPCDDHQNSICASCKVCNFTNEYEKVPCTPETGNTICNNIIKTSDECSTGQFRGLHTAYSQSVCSACEYRDTKYYGMTLHVPSGTGREYNNKYSCPVHCLGNSILRNPSDMSLGCKSCEAGNVLLRNIQVVTDSSGNKVNCSFTCRNGYEYDPVRDDCYITILQYSQSNFFYHTLEVGDFHNNISGFSMRVVHSNHGKFMVVVGPSEPLDCKRHFCCQSHMWRISTLEQAGLTTGLHADSCSQSNELTSVKVDENTIDFEISDLKLNDVARCLNYENGTTTCVFTVSIIDLILRKSLSREVVIHTKRSVQYTFTNNPQKFIPLNFLQADILFLYNHSDVPHFQMTLQLRADTNMKIWTRVSSLDQMHGNMLQPCSRLSTSHDSIFQNVSEPVHVLEGETVTIISYWYGNTNQFYENDIPFAHFLAYLTLQIGGDDSRNIMDVGVSRKLSLLNSLCHTPLHTTTLALGHVLYTAGLGSDVVKNVFNENSDFTHARGEIGTMFTFLAYSELPEVETISLERAMAIHLSKPNIIAPTELNKAVNTSDGVHFDFSASFRATCRSKKPHCAYGYFNNHFNTNPIFIMNNCSDSNKNLARKWILSEMGASNDHNHINSICHIMESLKPHSTKAFFLNSMSFIDKTNPIWNTFQNWTSPGTSTNIWAKFKFQV